MITLKNCNHCSVELTNEEMFFFEGKWYCSECLEHLCCVDTDNLSVEKLQEQLNSKVKALTEIRANIEEHNQIYDLDANTALLLEVIDGRVFEALAAIGGDDE